MSGVFTPELNHVKLESPTEDGKLAYVMNTMVPRRLDQFDDIKNDLANKNFNIDKAFLYVNFQAGDFCGRSYKIPLSELNDFTVRSLLFGVNGKDPVLTFDSNNFVVTKNNEIMLRLGRDSEGIPTGDELVLEKALQAIGVRISDLANVEYNHFSVLTETDAALELKKNNKFIILGSGDKLNSEGLPEPKEDTEDGAYGVHVTYDPKDDSGNPLYEGPALDSEGNKGPVIWIDHDYRFAQTITSKFDIGGIGKGQTILKGTPLETFIWQLLRGDPVIENIIYWKSANALPIRASTWTGLGPWGHNKTTTNDDLLAVADPNYTWKGLLEFTISTNDEYLMIAVPRSNSTGFKPDDQGQWIVPLLNSNKAPHGIKLHEIYLKDAPQFKVNFKTLDIRNEDESTEWGYKLYYIDEKSYYPQGQTWVAEFVPNE